MDHHIHSRPPQFFHRDHFQPVIITRFLRLQAKPQIIQDLPNRLPLASGCFQTPQDHCRGIRVFSRLFVVPLHRQFCRLFPALPCGSCRYQPWIELYQISPRRKNLRVLFHIPCCSCRKIFSIQCMQDPPAFFLIQTMQTIRDQTVFVSIQLFFHRIQFSRRQTILRNRYPLTCRSQLPNLFQQVFTSLRRTLLALPIFRDRLFQLLIRFIQTTLF